MKVLTTKELYIKNYRIINYLFAGIFGLIFLYSGIFSAQKNNHPIQSVCVVKPCSSTGLSRSFSEIVRFNFNLAQKFNKNGIAIFLFFFLEFFLRFAVNLVLTAKNFNKILYSDIIFSVLLYLLCFKGLLF